MHLQFYRNRCQIHTQNWDLPHQELDQANVGVCERFCVVLDGGVISQRVIHD